MNQISKMNKILYSLGFLLMVVMAEANTNASHNIDIPNDQLKEDVRAPLTELSSSNLLPGNASLKLPISKSIKESNSNSSKRLGQNDQKKGDLKYRESLKKENQFQNIIQQHNTMPLNSFDKELRYKGDQEEKKKGKLQTVGGVFGDIIGVIISEVVRIFGNIVSDVAREVTAHGFLSVFKQFTDLTGISLNANHLI